MDFKGILIVCDLDRTVVVNDDISDIDAAAAMAFTAKGGLLSIATGRLRDSAKRFADTLGVNCPVICQNGGYIFDFKKNQEVFSVFLHNCVYELTRELMCDFPAIRMQIFSHQKIYFLGYGELPGGPMRYKVIAEGLKDVPKPWAKVLFYASPETLSKLRQKAETLDTGKNFDLVYSNDTLLELLPKGVNKGKALLKLAKLLGVSRVNTVAIGDNENDIELVREAGLGLAVNGAFKPLAEAADIVLPYACGTALFGTVRMLKNGDLKVGSKL